MALRLQSPIERGQFKNKWSGSLEWFQDNEIESDSFRETYGYKKYTP